MEEAEFDKFAAEYDQLHARNIRISGEQPSYFAEYKVADAADVFATAGLSVSGQTILDLGAGVGASVPYFLKYFPACRMTCADVSRKSLRIGESQHCGNAEFVHFDGADLPFPSDHFDLAFIACVLHHVPHEEHERILSEVRRVLRPKGNLIVFEHNPYNPLTVRAVNTCPFDDNAVLLKPRQLAAKLAKVGFEDPSVAFRIFFPHALASMRWLEAWIKWLPLGAQYRVHARKG